MNNLKKYGQYKESFFTKLNFPFENGKRILDVGCGDATDALIFNDIYGLKVTGIDVYEHENIKNLSFLEFKKNEEGIYKIPYEGRTFDYVFLHDVLHHIDEKDQSYQNHLKGLKEVKRVVKPGGYIIIAEGNRYNPLFYPHMVKMLGHEHFRQSYFKKLMKDVYGSDFKFKYFEAHLYPSFIPRPVWKSYEWVMENMIPCNFSAYNVAVVKNDTSI